MAATGPERSRIVERESAGYAGAGWGMLRSHSVAFEVKISGFLPPRGDPCDSPQRSGVSKRRSGRAMGRRTAGASNEARMRPHKAAAAIRRFATEAASGKCRACSGRRRPRSSSWRRGMMSMRPAKHIKGDRSSVLLRLAPKSLVFGLFGAISGSESPLTRRIRTPGQLQRLRRPHTHKPRARTPQARWKRPRPHHRRRSRERRDGATPFGLRAATNSSAATPRWRATAWRTYRPTRKRRRCRLGRAWTRSRFEPGLSATGGDPAHGRARAPERVRARKNCWTPRLGPCLGPEQLGGHPRHRGVHPPTRLHLPAAEEKPSGSGRATVVAAAGSARRFQTRWLWRPTPCRRRSRAP